MSKNDSLCQHSEKRINMKYLPQWNDDNMSSLSDNNSMEEDDHPFPDDVPLDANQIDDFDSYVGVPVMDKFGNIVGERMEYCKRKRKKRHEKK